MQIQCTHCRAPMEEASVWIANARAVVNAPDRCQSKQDVQAAMVPVEGLVASDPGHETIQQFDAALRTCLDNVPPPSAWRYDVRADPMGGRVAAAVVESANTFEFDFAYQGSQHAQLMVRRDSGLDVALSVETGQFMCTLGCSVLVRFDGGSAIRWGATRAADHSTTTIFLRGHRSS